MDFQVKTAYFEVFQILCVAKKESFVAFICFSIIIIFQRGNSASKTKQKGYKMRRYFQTQSVKKIPKRFWNI